jgi:hypothetical protein
MLRLGSSAFTIVHDGLVACDSTDEATEFGSATLLVVEWLVASECKDVGIDSASVMVLTTEFDRSCVSVRDVASKCASLTF